MAGDSKLEELLSKLKDENPKARRKACEQLAKLGNPEAIVGLVNVYHRPDEDKQVREAAAKALRVFAAQEARANRSGESSKLLRFITVGLTFSLVVLVLLNVALRMGGGDGTPSATAEAAANPTPSNRDELLTRYAMHLVQAQEVVTELTSEWNAGAGKLPCGQTSPMPPAAPLSAVDQATFPDFGFVTDLNLALAMLQTVLNDWQLACQSAEKGTAEQASSALQRLRDVQDVLNQVAAAIDEATFNPMPTVGPSSTPTPNVTATPNASPTPTIVLTATQTPTITPTPAPTVDPTILRDLERLVGNGQVAMNTLLNDRWLVVQEGGQSAFGCSVSPIDADYTTAPPELLVNEPDLAETINLINQALAWARSSSQAYQTACQNNRLTAEVISQGITEAQQALSNFELAALVIQQYKSRSQ